MRKASRILGAGMLMFAVFFVAFALTHPELSFPWDNLITYTLYGVYIAVAVILLIAPFGKK